MKCSSQRLRSLFIPNYPRNVVLCSVWSISSTRLSFESFIFDGKIKLESWSLFEKNAKLGDLRVGEANFVFIKIL